MISLNHFYRRPLNSLYLTPSILHFGLSMIGIFVPIYIFQLTGNFYYLPAFYGVLSLLAIFSLLAAPTFLLRLGPGLNTFPSQKSLTGHRIGGQKDRPIDLDSLPAAIFE